jgi:hypothetical protein
MSALRRRLRDGCGRESGISADSQPSVHVVATRGLTVALYSR